MVLSNQPMPYVGNGCPYCGAGWDEQKIVDHESYERSGTALYEYGHCLRCNTDYKLRYVATHWVGDNGIHHPLSLVTAEPELPMAKAVYPEVVNDLIERVAAGQEKYGCVLSTHNDRNALQDVYEELMDALLYLKQLQMEANNGLESSPGKS